MDWKDEEVQQAWDVFRKEGMRQVMTRAVELAAARDGGKVAAGLIQRYRNENETLRARNAVLEEERNVSRRLAMDAEAEVEKLKERLTAAEEANRQIVRRAQQAESEVGQLRRTALETNRKAKEYCERAVTAEARCATLSAAGQVLSAHVDKAFTAEDSGEVVVLTGPVDHYPCSATCTHDDAATPGHPERVKERSEAVSAVIDPSSHNNWADLESAQSETDDSRDAIERVAEEDAYERGAEAMRAACLGSVLALCDQEGMTPGLRRMFQAAIEGAVP